jgi:hypothetical protein
MTLNLPLAPSPTDPDPLVLYHGRGCTDGFAAALAAWLYYAGRVTCQGVDHGDVRTLADLPPLVGRAVYVLDFSFAPELLQAMAGQAAKLVMLDHHKSAAQQWAGHSLTQGVVHFDMGQSGASLAWNFFFPDQPMPDLVRYVQDRDLWAWAYPESAAYLAALDMEPLDFARWQAIAQMDAAAQQAFIARGQAMDDKFAKLAEQIAEHARPLVFNGVKGLMVNAPGGFHSLVGDLLAKQSGTFALMWTVDKNGVVKCGLRSRSGFDCIPLAESLGGGGHAQACGARLPVARLPELLSGQFQA